MQKRYLRLAFLALLLACILGVCPQRRALAATHNYYLSPSSDTAMCDTAGDSYTIGGTGSGHAVRIEGGTEGNPIYVTLDNLTVNAGGARGDGNAPVQVESGYCVLALRGSNRLVSGWHDITIKSDEGVAALRVRSGATCVITSADGDGSTNGSLYAECTHDDHGGAGIGSNYNEDTGTIIIRGGSIEAHGGHCGAGIGSGRDGVCTLVSVEGGDVRAYGGEYAAGIGGGDAVGTGEGGNVRDLRISGGSVHAFGGGNGGAGIGGSEGGDTNSITITGGVIEATGQDAAGIGGGEGHAASSITINQAAGTDLSIQATGGDESAGIGSSDATSGSISIQLAGGSVVATGGNKGAGIGGGNKQNGPISIGGYGEIRATAGRDAAAIGAGHQRHSQAITIAGSGPNHKNYPYPLIVVAHGGPTDEGAQNAALIGAGDGTADTICIRGAYVRLEPSSGGHLYGAGIGTGCSNDLSLSDGGIGTIDISNSQVVLSNTTWLHGAGIGAGYGSNVSNIVLNNVVYSGTTIGSSHSNRLTTHENNMSSIRISNSNVTAKAVDHGSPWAGIGTGPYGSIDSIAIVNSDVVAEGACGGAGIGTGGLEFAKQFPLKAILSGDGKCGDVAIQSTGSVRHTVVARGGGGGAGIGGGQLTSLEGEVLIDHMDVTATTGTHESECAAGIGGGSACSCNSVTINDSTVTATGGVGGAGIGTGGLVDETWVSGLVSTAWNTTCGNIRIAGGSDVTATAGTGAAGIGLGQGAQQKNGTSIRIDASTVSAVGGEAGAGIGAGRECGLGRGAEARRIYITGRSRVTATGGAGAAGIGGGYTGSLETCRIALTNYYNDSSSPTTESAHAFVKAYGGAGAAGIGGGASSHYSTSKGTLDDGHRAYDIRIEGGFVAAYGGNATDSPYGRSGPGAGIGGGSYEGNLEDCSISGGVVIARGGSKTSGLSTAVAAQDIGRGGTRDGGRDGSEDIGITDGTVVGSINQNETVRINGGSVVHAFGDGEARQYASKGDAVVYQTSFMIDSNYLPATEFEGETFYKLDDLATSVPSYGCAHVFARKVSDERAQVWMYLPTSAQEGATADFRCKTSTTSAAAPRHYYGTTAAARPDFGTNTNVLKMGAPIVLEPDASTPVPYAGEDFRLNVRDQSHALVDATVAFTLTNATGVAQEPRMSADAYTVIKPTTAGQELSVLATVGNNPAPDLYWDSKATYAAMVEQRALSIKITSDPSRLYNGQEIADPSVSITGTTHNATFVYAGEGLESGAKPVKPGTYTVTASVSEGAQTASDSRTFTISKYKALLTLDVQDRTYTGAPVAAPGYSVAARETDSPATTFEQAGGTVVFSYQKSVQNGWDRATTEPPTEVGFYRVKAHTVENDYYLASNTVPAFFSVVEAPQLRDPYLFVDMPESVVYNNAAVEVPLVWTNSDGAVSYAYYQGSEAVANKQLSAAPKDAGSYCVVVSVAQTSTYAAASQTCAFTITPRPATLSIAANPSGESGATVAVTLSGALDDVVNKEDKQVSLSIAKNGEATQDKSAKLSSSYVATFVFDSVNSGEYTLTASFADANYTVADATRTFNKENSEYVVTLSDVTKTYGDAPFNLEASVTDSLGNAVGNPSLTYELVSAAPAADDVVNVIESGQVTILNAGTATVQATMPADDTHRAGVATATITVLPAQSTLTVEALSKTYDGMPAEITCTPSHGLAVDDISYAYYQAGGSGYVSLDAAPTDPGSYGVVATLPATRNYKSAAGSATYTIRPYTATIEVFAADKTCDGTPATVWNRVSATETGSPAKGFGEGGGAVTYEYARSEGDAWVDLDASPVEAGSYRVTAYAAGDTYYTDATGDAFFVIEPARLPTHIQLQTSSKTYDGNPATATATVLDAQDEVVEELSAEMAYYVLEQDGTYTRLEGAPVDVGSYGVRATTPGNEDYYSSEARAPFSIWEVPPKPADPYLFVDMPSSVVYDARMVDDPLVWTTSDGDVDVAYYKNGVLLASRPVDAGTYTVVVSTGATERFNAARVEREFTIQRRLAPLVLSAAGDVARGGATVRVKMVNGLEDVEGGNILLSVCKSGGSAGEPLCTALVARGDDYVANYTFDQVETGEYELVARVPDDSPLLKNYIILPAERAFSKDMGAYEVLVQNETKSFGDEPFALQVVVTDDAGEVVDSPNLSYRLIDAPEASSVLSDDVISIDNAGNVSILNTGVAVCRVEVEGDNTHAGDVGYAIVSVGSIDPGLVVTATSKVYDGAPAEVTYTVDSRLTGNVDILYFRAGEGPMAESADSTDAEATLPAVEGELLEEAPTSPGSYVAVAIAHGDRNFTGAVSRASFDITSPDLPDEPDDPKKPVVPDVPSGPDEPSEPDRPSSTPDPDSPREPSAPNDPVPPATTPDASEQPPVQTSDSAAARAPLPNTADTFATGLLALMLAMLLLAIPAAKR